MSDEIITAQHRAFARAVVAAARQCGMHEFSATLTFAATFNHPRTFHQVQMHWQQGRHGAGSRVEISLSAKQDVKETIAEGDTP